MSRADAILASASAATREQLEAFILRAGFPGGWLNLESWARRMAEQAVKELNATPETMTLREVWEAAGGNPGINPSRQDVMTALHILDEVSEEADAPTESGVMMRDFRTDLTALINTYSKENGSDTPDFILADYLLASLGAFDRTVRNREAWHGRAKEST